MRSSLWPVVFALGALAAGCGGPSRTGNPQTYRAAAKPRHSGPVLSPICPLGAVSVQGLNPVDKGCAAASRTHPAGPVGAPNLP